MHYRLRKTAEDIHRAEIDFLKEQLSHLAQFRADREKLLEMKKQGECKAMIKFKASRWSIARRRERSMHLSHNGVKPR